MDIRIIRIAAFVTPLMACGSQKPTDDTATSGEPESWENNNDEPWGGGSSTSGGSGETTGEGEPTDDDTGGEESDGGATGGEGAKSYGSLDADMRSPSMIALTGV